MKIETLKKSHLKRNIIIGVVVVAIISTVILNFTRAKYRVTQSIPLVNGTINYSLPDLNIVGLYIDGEEATELDSSKKYTLDTTQSTCIYKDGTEIKDLTITYDSETGGLSISPYTIKGTKCTLYFEEKVYASDTILANTELKTDTPDFRKTSCTNGSNNGSNCGEETVGLYKEETSKGTTYYYRGDVENNYLVFADKYWRIIRINEDGSLRIIYQGTSNTATGSSTQIGTSAFNSSYNRSEYVGYTYTEGLQRPSSQNGGTPSTIKGILDSWYSTNIGNKTEYDNKVASGGSAGFCNDREMASGYTWSSEPSSTIRYAANERIYTNRRPSYECSNTNDMYTTKIGLITADEVMYAGGTNSNNYGYYLYTGNSYWTMSPFFCNSTGGARVLRVDSLGILGGNGSIVNDTYGVRPVINLRSDVTISGGNGTSSNPYVIS